METRTCYTHALPCVRPRPIKKQMVSRDCNIKFTLNNIIKKKMFCLYCVDSLGTATTSAAVSSFGSSTGFGSPLDAVSAVSSAVDVLATMQSSHSSIDPLDRIATRGAGLREMMRRATRSLATSGVDMTSHHGSGSEQLPPFHRRGASSILGPESLAASSGSVLAAGNLPLHPLPWPAEPPNFDTSLSGKLNICLQRAY